MARAATETKHSNFATIAVALAAIAFVLWMASLDVGPPRFDRPTAHAAVASAGELHRALPSA